MIVLKRKQILIGLIGLCLVLILGLTFANRGASANQLYAINVGSSIGKKVDAIPPTNILTGLPLDSRESVGLRPVSVMVSNVPQSMPQWGIGSADVVFEVPVEGGMTRLMVVFGNMNEIPNVAPVRSARPFIPRLARALDSFYLHWGGASSIMGEVRNIMGNSRIDVNNSTLFRHDPSRMSAGFAQEHASVLDGARFKAEMQGQGNRIFLNDDFSGEVFNFKNYDESLPMGNVARSISVNFGGTRAGLTFDTESKLYSKTFNGQPHIDGLTNSPLVFTNVIVLETPVGISGTGHATFNTSGNGTYFSNGNSQAITWILNDRLELFDGDGNPLAMNRGKSYIAITHVGGVSFN